MSELVTGSIGDVFGNPHHLYEGDLWHYFRVINNAPNARNPYHNTRHVLHTMWLMYRACEYHAAELSKRRIRNTLVAGGLHDHGHPGHNRVPDAQNILIAQAAVARYAAPEDKLEVPRIKKIVGASLFTKNGHLPAESLEEEIMQDCDTAQAMNPAWYALICDGLAVEFDIEREVMLERQLVFLEKLHFQCQWAKTTYPQSAIDMKRRETETILKGLRAHS